MLVLIAVLAAALPLMAAWGGPILPPVEADSAAQAQTAAPPIVAPLMVSSGVTANAAIKLRSLNLLGRDVAGNALAAWLRSPEENLGIVRPETYDPGAQKVAPEFFTAIGLDPPTIARTWGKIDAITSLEQPIAPVEHGYEIDAEDIQELKQEFGHEFGDALTYDQYKLKDMFASFPRLGPKGPPPLQTVSVGWLRDLVAKVHRVTEVTVTFLHENLYYLITANLLILLWLNFLYRRRR